MCICVEEHCPLHGPLGSESQVGSWVLVHGRDLRRIRSAEVDEDGALVLGVGADLRSNELPSDICPPRVTRFLTDAAAEIVRLWNELPFGQVLLHLSTPEVEVWRPSGLERFSLVQEGFEEDPDRPLHLFGPDARLFLPVGTKLRPAECGFELPTGEYLRLHSYGLVREGEDGREVHPMPWSHITRQERAWRERTKWGAGGDATTTARSVEVVLPIELHLCDDERIIEVCRELEHRTIEAELLANALGSEEVIVVDLSDVAADI